MGILYSYYGDDIVTVTTTTFFNCVSHEKDIDTFTEGEIQKDYKPFIINRMIAQYKELIFFADAMNVSHDISKEHQLFFYNMIIPKKTRRALWNNKSKNRELSIIMQYYNLSQEKADPYLRILTREQINELEERLNIGGKE